MMIMANMKLILLRLNVVSENINLEPSCSMSTTNNPTDSSNDSEDSANNAANKENVLMKI